MKRPRCQHDKVYSGHTSLEQEFAYICIKCGQSGWGPTIELHRVNLPLYNNIRELHGWPARLTAPPSRAQLNYRAQAADTRARIKRHRVATRLLTAVSCVAWLLVICLVHKTWATWTAIVFIVWIGVTHRWRQRFGTKES